MPSCVVKWCRSHSDMRKEGGVSFHTHGKRSDKETQSPMLKIFKDMMIKDKRDPEKTNLLKEKHQDRKRKIYYSSRSKSGHKAALSSSSDQPKEEHQQEYKRAEHQVRNTTCLSEQTIPCQSEKRESWWFWGSQNAPNKSTKSKHASDTCSCVSCALQKLLSTEYTCVACIALLFIVSVMVGVWMLYRSVPCMSSGEAFVASTGPFSRKTDSERLKRKIGGLGKWSFGPKKEWQNIFTKHDSVDFGSFQRNDVASLVESENELSKILDTDKLNDVQNSDRLKDFYKKLVQTDAAIRSLRKSFNENSYVNNFDSNSNFNNLNINVDLDNNGDVDNNDDPNRSIDIIYPDRSKRSIKNNPNHLFNFKRRKPATQSKINNGKLITKSTVNMTDNKHPLKTKSSRKKRYDNFTDGSFLIEKNKVIIQYKPNRKVAKCSHAPKDSKSHEIQLNHPFYKNTQRLDELLNQFMYNKKMPDFPSDQFDIFDQNKKCKHPSNNEIILVKDDYISKDYDSAQKVQQKDEDHNKKYRYLTSGLQVETEKVTLEKDKIDQATISDYTTPKVTMKVKNAKDTRNAFDNDVFEKSDGVEKERRSSTSGFDILLSISTSSIPAVKVSTSNPSTNFPERPNMRKLLQAKIKEQDAMTYEDLTVVAPNYKEGSKQKDKGNVKKENNDEIQMKLISVKSYPSSVQNPNWKGAMPLYPEELNVIMKPSSDPGNKVEVPVHSRYTVPESYAPYPRLTDVEYVEDYLDNGYEKLVELAQAYSDYGVLNKKNEVDKEKQEVEEDRQKSKKKRLGLSMKRLKNSLKRGMKSSVVLDKLEKGRAITDGIKIEIHPDPTRSEAPASTNFKGIFHKHVKMVSDNQDKKCVDKMILHALVTPKPEPDVVTPQANDFNEPFITKIKTTKTLDPEPDTILYKKRTLKAFEKGHVATDEMKNKFKVQLKRDTNAEVIYKEIEGDSFKDRPVDSNQNKMGNLKSSGKNIELNEKNVKVKADGKTRVSPNSGQYKFVTKENASLSNFFMQLSNWLNTLDQIEINSKNAPKMTPSDTDHDQSSKTKSQLIDSVHDPDTAEDIIHKSRALLSVDIYNNTEKVSRSDEEDNLVALQSSTEPINTNKTLLVENIKDTANNEGTTSNNTDNKIVKRQAIDDSNLIFWNDLYDEEYGINADPLENNIRDKHSIDRNYFIKKSNSWIHDKVKKIADRFYPTETKIDAKAKSEDKSKQVKRSAKYDENDEENSGKVNFSALTERMKEVCKETVKAVQDTRHIEVREENKPGHATSTLMQQLVRLMTDLVDFQVQERTCRKLPADLQTFLDWLTSTKEEDSDLGTYTEKNFETYGMSFENTQDKPTEQDLFQSSERENTDSKTDCLGTLHAVQNLIREYEEMSEDDKSRMIGVKDYLENQIQFLQRQLTSIEDKQYNKNRFRRDIIADVGHTIADTVDDSARNIDKQYKNLKKYYHKYKGKAGQAYKHAIKSTEQIKLTIEDMGKKMTTTRTKPKPSKISNKLLKLNDKPKQKISKGKVTKEHKDRKVIKPKNEKQRCGLKNKSKVKIIGKTEFDNEDANDFNYDFKIKGYTADLDTQAFGNRIKDERNIKDVYFKAVEEAKKATISKGAQRDSEVFDKTDILRINDYVAEKENDSQIDVFSH